MYNSNVSGAWYVWSDGDAYDDLYVYYSYGRNDRRTRVIPLARTWSILMEMPALTTTMSHVPTVKSPDTYMGGSEGVMQVADYGEIQFETWLNSSYGTISPNRNHTNETINAFRISSSGDIDGRNWIFTTGSYGI